MEIPESILREIKSRIAESWGHDSEMQEYCEKAEIEGYKKYRSLDFGEIDEAQKKEIVDLAHDIYEGWDEIAEFLEEELRALEKIKTLSEDGCYKNQFQVWLEEARKESDCLFSGQLEFIERKISICQAVRETRAEIDPIKALLIDLEKIVGNECYNANIQNYSSWGELESEGRSFRYPVEFLQEDGSQRRRVVTEDIPSEELITGYYPFGANELNIYRALYKIIKHLESNYAFKVPKT